MSSIWQISMCLAVACTTAFSVAGQTGDTINPLQHNVTTGYLPTINKSEKYSSEPAIESAVMPAPELQYSLLKKQVKTTFEVQPILPAKMKGEPLTKLYRSYARLGVGTYSTTYGELFVNNNRSRQHSIGAHFKHLASSGQIKNVGQSGYSENTIEMFGKKFLRKHLLSGTLDYDREVVHFYGYDPADFASFNKDNTRQRFSRMGGTAGLMSFYKDSMRINHDVGLEYYQLTDLFDAKENNAKVTAELQRYFNSELFRLSAAIDYNQFNVDSTINNSNALVKLNPKVIAKGEKWQLQAGLGIYSEMESTAYFHFYPDAHFKYNVVGYLIIPYVGLTGKMQRNNFKGLTDENPYLTPIIQLRNSNYKYKLYGGVRGAMGSDLSFNLQAAKYRVEDMPLFVNDTLGSALNQFSVIYDHVTTINLNAEATYQRIDKLAIVLRGDYYWYNMENELMPWHLPTYKLTLSGVYDLKDKIVVKGDIFAISKTTARSFNPADGEYLGYGIYRKELKGTIDVNLAVEYRYTKKLSAFLHFNNIGAVRYYRWNNYPSQRFSVLGGIAYSFWGN